MDEPGNSGATAGRMSLSRSFRTMSDNDTETYGRHGEQLDNEIEVLRGRLSHLEQQLADLDDGGGIPEDVDAALARLQGAIDDHSTTLADAQNRLDALESAVAALEEGAGGRSDEEIRQLIGGYIDEHGGAGDADLKRELEAIRRERTRFSLVGSPSHKRTLAPGNHTDTGYHKHGSWGLVVTAHEDVVWREATVNTESAGSTLLEIYDMEYEQATTYDVGELLGTHELTLQGGKETIHPDIVLEAGQTVFITRDTDVPRSQALPLKRGMEDVPWAEFNDNDVPLTVHCSWQLGRGGPGTQEFEDWRSANWHRVLHNYRDLEFGFNELVE